MTDHRSAHVTRTDAIRRTGGLWDALAAATSEEDPAAQRRRLAALRLRRAIASLADFEPCA